MALRAVYEVKCSQWHLLVAIENDWEANGRYNYFFFGLFYVCLLKRKVFSGQFSSLKIDIDTIADFQPPTETELEGFEEIVRCSCDTDNDDKKIANSEIEGTCKVWYL